MGRKAKRRDKGRPDLATLASQVLRDQVAEARAHVVGAMEGSDPEQLHDLRVAVRRMRAALRLFGRGLPAGYSALNPASGGLKETGANLGRARDLDVQIGRLDSWLRATGGANDPAASRAVKLFARDRAIARLALRRHLAGRVFEGRIAAVEAAAVAVGKIRGPGEPARLLRRPSKRVLGAIGTARAVPAIAENFHALRIDVKKLRYALEFLEPGLLFSPRKLLRLLRSAQDTLGALQDAAVEQAVAEALIARAGDDEPVRALLEHYKHSQADAQAAQMAAGADLLDDLDLAVRELRERL